MCRSQIITIYNNARVKHVMYIFSSSSLLLLGDRWRWPICIDFSIRYHFFLLDLGPSLYVLIFLLKISWQYLTFYSFIRTVILFSIFMFIYFMGWGKTHTWICYEKYFVCSKLMMFSFWLLSIRSRRNRLVRLGNWLK